jgi:hypothetical protein
MPDPQRQTAAFQFEALGVEVDRVLYFTLLRFSRPADQGYRVQPREIRGRQLQLDFDFFRG